MEVKKSGNEEQKKWVAERASELIQDGMTIGLGTGSTVGCLVKRIGEKLEKKDFEIRAICSSYETKKRAINQSIPITSFEETEEIDLSIDGADQVDNKLNLIKGGGAAHLREKILAVNSEEFICIVDETKVSEKLNRPVPLEVLPFSLETVKNKIEEMEARCELRQSKKKDGPIVTDNGNYILDADFGIIDDPNSLSIELGQITGLIEHGIFPGLADRVLVGKNDEIVKND